MMTKINPNDPEIEALAALFASPAQDAKARMQSANYYLPDYQLLAKLARENVVLDLKDHFMFTRDHQAGRVGYFVAIKPIVLLNLLSYTGTIEDRPDWAAALNYRLGAAANEVMYHLAFVTPDVLAHATCAQTKAGIDLTMEQPLNSPFKVGRRVIIAAVSRGPNMGQSNTWLEVDSEEIPPHAAFVDLAERL